MMNYAARASAPAANVLGHQLCPECGHALVAPDAAQHVSEHTIRHIWFCEACGTEFSTVVKLRRRESDCAAVAA